MMNNNLVAMFNSSAPVVILMRHAEKEKNGGKESERGLTTDGKQAALAMGKEMALASAGRPINIWHSPIPRCRQTAEQIALGAGIGNIRGECLHLAGIPDFIVANNLKDGEKIKNDAVSQLKKNNNNESFGNVVNILKEQDKYPNFKKPTLGAAVLANFLLDRASGDIDINVSHDWIIYLMACLAKTEHLPFIKNRVGFLEYLSLQNNDDGTVGVSYQNKSGVLVRAV